ncbi:hypothetical protein BJ165DRAFT_1533198 [Panaeolus papilionaceus]|nr:hypothetical protein BJ165DRAFT_1533198 [Panaeolus papilionaceus]
MSSKIRPWGDHFRIPSPNKYKDDDYQCDKGRRKGHGLTPTVESETPNQISTGSKIDRDDIKWQELLRHFRTVQAKHEKTRRQALGSDTAPILGFQEDKISWNSEKRGRARPVGRPPLHRRATGAPEMQGVVSTHPVLAPPRTRALSPLNPNSRVPSTPTSINGTASAPTPPSSLNPITSGLTGFSDIASVTICGEFSYLVYSMCYNWVRPV